MLVDSPQKLFQCFHRHAGRDTRCKHRGAVEDKTVTATRGPNPARAPEIRRGVSRSDKLGIFVGVFTCDPFSGDYDPSEYCRCKATVERVLHKGGASTPRRTFSTQGHSASRTAATSPSLPSPLRSGSHPTHRQTPAQPTTPAQPIPSVGRTPDRWFWQGSPPL